MKILIPADFPREVFGAVPGAQPKLLVRKVGDRYVSGSDEAEIAQRYAICADLVEQLIPYARRHHEMHRDWNALELQRRMRDAIQKKGWDFSGEEIWWIAEKACKGLL